MLALVTVVERYVERHDLLFASVLESAWKWSGDHVATAAGRPVVGFGDSLVKNSLLPSVLDARSGMKAWNLAVPSGQAPLHYFLFRRLLRAPARPLAVVIDGEAADADPLFDPRVWGRGSGSTRPSISPGRAATRGSCPPWRCPRRCRPTGPGSRSGRASCRPLRGTTAAKS